MFLQGINLRLELSILLKGGASIGWLIVNVCLSLKTSVNLLTILS